MLSAPMSIMPNCFMPIMACRNDPRHLGPGRDPLSRTRSGHLRPTHPFFLSLPHLRPHLCPSFYGLPTPPLSPIHSPFLILFSPPPSPTSPFSFTSFSFLFFFF